MKGKRAESRPADRDGLKRVEGFFDHPVGMVFSKQKASRGKDGLLVGRCVFRVPLPGVEAEGLPAFIEAGLGLLGRSLGCNEVRFTEEYGPLNMRCRALPPDAEVGAVTEQYLPEVTWRKLRLVREETGIQLHLELAFAVDEANWNWVRESVGTQLWAEIEEAQRELPVSAEVRVIDGRVQ